jgi:lysophospholipase L1-like esterase
MALTRRKFLAFAAAASLLSLLVVLAGVLAADLYLHHRAERSAGLNRWGHRGPVAGRKQPGEVRLVMLGGSTVFGYGGTWDEAIPALLEQQLSQADAGRRWRGINLGYNSEGAYAFLPTLQDFEYLDYDIVILYEGYNDMQGDRIANLAVYRHDSPVFRLTGYFPMLPLVLGEKAMALRHGGDLEGAYAAARGERAKTVFRPGLADRTSAAALEAAAKVSDTLSRQIGRLAAADAPRVAGVGESGCASPWMHYCDSVARATEYALARGKRVIVASQPALRATGSAEHADQQKALAEMIARKFGNNPRVRYVDLTGTVDLRDVDLAFDGMHLGADGNLIIAKALVAPVRSLAGGGGSPP